MPFPESSPGPGWATLQPGEESGASSPVSQSSNDELEPEDDELGHSNTATQKRRAPVGASPKERKRQRVLDTETSGDLPAYTLSGRPVPRKRKQPAKSVAASPLSTALHSSSKNPSSERHEAVASRENADSPDIPELSTLLSRARGSQRRPSNGLTSSPTRDNRARASPASQYKPESRLPRDPQLFSAFFTPRDKGKDKSKLQSSPQTAPPAFRWPKHRKSTSSSTNGADFINLAPSHPRLSFSQTGRKTDPIELQSDSENEQDTPSVVRVKPPSSTPAIRQDTDVIDLCSDDEEGREDHLALQQPITSSPAAMSPPAFPAINNPERNAEIEDATIGEDNIAQEAHEPMPDPVFDNDDALRMNESPGPDLGDEDPSDLAQTVGTDADPPEASNDRLAGPEDSAVQHQTENSPVDIQGLQHFSREPNSGQAVLSTGHDAGDLDDNSPDSSTALPEELNTCPIESLRTTASNLTSDSPSQSPSLAERSPSASAKPSNKAVYKGSKYSRETGLWARFYRRRSSQQTSRGSLSQAEPFLSQQPSASSNQLGNETPPPRSPPPADILEPTSPSQGYELSDSSEGRVEDLLEPGQYVSRGEVEHGIQPSNDDCPTPQATAEMSGDKDSGPSQDKDPASPSSEDPLPFVRPELGVTFVAAGPLPRPYSGDEIYPTSATLFPHNQEEQQVIDLTIDSEDENISDSEAILAEALRLRAVLPNYESDLTGESEDTYDAEHALPFTTAVTSSEGSPLMLVQRPITPEEMSEMRNELLGPSRRGARLRVPSTVDPVMNESSHVPARLSMPQPSSSQHLFPSVPEAISASSEKPFADKAGSEHPKALGFFEGDAVDGHASDTASSDEEMPLSRRAQRFYSPVSSQGDAMDLGYPDSYQELDGETTNRPRARLRSRGSRSVRSSRPSSASHSSPETEGSQSSLPMDIIDANLDELTSRPGRIRARGRSQASEEITSGIRDISLDTAALEKEIVPTCHRAEDLPHLLQDHMNSLPSSYLKSDFARVIFEATMSESTAEDEPDAPVIRIYNPIDGDDEVTPPWEFHYSNYMWHGKGVPGPDHSRLRGCGCKGPCDPKSKTCSCLRRQEKYTEGVKGFLYDEKGRLKRSMMDYPIFECNDLCGCSDECRNRVVQRGRTCAINIVKTKSKGWGVFAGDKRIPCGTYIGIYAGELLTDAEGEQRGLKYNKFGRTYLFDIDFWYIRKEVEDWEVTYTVDAYHAGNFTRFLNHSCDPNCSLVPCYINEGNIEKPLLTVFTRRDVEAYEELCFSYTGPPDEDEEEATGPSMPDHDDAIYVPCKCGARNCKGRMF